MATCPDGRCDGSGFLFDEARAARAAVLVPAGADRAQAGGRARGADPEALPRGLVRPRAAVSIERANPHVVREVRRYVRTIAEQLDAGRGLWFTGDVGTGKTTLAMLDLQGRDGGRPHRRDLLAPAPAGELRETFDDDARYSLNELIDRLCAVDLLHIDDVGAEQTLAVGARAALHDRQHALRGRQRDPAHDEPRHARRRRRAARADRRAHGLAPVRDVRRPAADVRRRPPAARPLRRCPSRRRRRRTPATSPPTTSRAAPRRAFAS